MFPARTRRSVCYLRSLSDCRAIIGKAAGAKRVVLVGASFIAMEVASSLIQRKLQVHVVAPEAVPMERTLGPQVGQYLRHLHERNGVVFHLQQAAAAIDERKVTLNDGQAIEADLVVIGIGVKPLTDLAERAGIKTDNGVCVNEYLETSVPQIFAAGDIARWPDAAHRGPIFESSIGWWPNARDRRPHRTYSATASGSTPLRSSGPANTILRLTMSVTLRSGTSWIWTAVSRNTTASFHFGAAERQSPWPQ